MVTKYLLCTALFLSLGCRASSEQGNIHTLYTSFTAYRHAMQLPNRSPKKREICQSRKTKAKKLFSAQIQDIWTQVRALENRAFQATPDMSFIQEKELVDES